MEDSSSAAFSNTFIISKSILAVLFLIGIYLQIRIIIVSKRHKITTWTIDISHSIIMIIYFTFRIFFQLLIDIFPSVHEHCGAWICYLALFIQIFCGLSMVSNSLLVALYKYLYTVRHDLLFFISPSKETASVVLIFVNFLIQAALSVSAIARPSQIRLKAFTVCLGHNIRASEDRNPTTPVVMLKKFFFCGFDDYKGDQFDGIFSIVMDVTNITGCFITSIVFFIVLANLMEIFLYQRIFTHMKRYGMGILILN